MTRALDIANSVVSGVGPDQWHLSTPCTEFDTSDLTCHLVGAIDRVSNLAKGLAVHGELPLGPAPLEGWPTKLASSKRSVLGNWTDDDLLDRSFSLPWGTYQGTDIVLMYTIEFVAHSWDLAVATDQDAQLDDDLALAVLPAAQKMIPAGFRGGEMPFASVVELSPGARGADQLAAFLGRSRPRAGVPVDAA
jgi:uncharacterized protein (TIGR03086 family)